MNSTWPHDLPAVQVRIARQTDQLETIEKFYCEGLGLQVISRFKGHAGYDGVMIGLPDLSYHLEFISHVDGSPGAAPSDENLLVFYIPDKAAIERTVDRLKAMGYPNVPSANPWWDEHEAVTIADPDGWRVVLQPGNGLTHR